MNDIWNRVDEFPTFELEEGQSAYDLVEEYIRRYWKHRVVDSVIVSLGISYDNHLYTNFNELANLVDLDLIEFEDDWWSGQKFIQIRGIEDIGSLAIHGGIFFDHDSGYDEDLE